MRDILFLCKKKDMKEFFKEIGAAVTVSDVNGDIVYMNDKSAKTFENYGGRELIGKSLFGCHPAPAASKLKKMLLTHESNSYTIEKNGIRKIILQRPWFENSVFMGYVEFSFEIPAEMQHFVRK